MDGEKRKFMNTVRSFDGERFHDFRKGILMHDHFNLLSVRTDLIHKVVWQCPGTFHPRPRRFCTTSYRSPTPGCDTAHWTLPCPNPWSGSAISYRTYSRTWNNCKQSTLSMRPSGVSANQQGKRISLFELSSPVSYEHLHHVTVVVFYFFCFQGAK